MAKKTIKNLPKVKTPAKGKELPSEVLERVVGGVVASMAASETDTCSGGCGT